MTEYNYSAGIWMKISYTSFFMWSDIFPAWNSIQVVPLHLHRINCFYFSCNQWIISSHHCHHSDNTFSRERCLEYKRCKLQAGWLCKACAGWGWAAFIVWLLMWPGRGASLICLWFCLAYTSTEVVQNADVLFRSCWSLRQEACQHCWMSQGTLE